MKTKLLLLFGIPLVFIIGIIAWETQNFLWLGFYVPLAVVRYFMRKEQAKKDIFYIPPGHGTEVIDTNHSSQQTHSRNQ